MPAGPVISLSPSFNSYSNTKLTQIAARVVKDFNSDDFYDQFYFANHTPQQQQEEADSDEEEHEFAFVIPTDTSKFPSPVSADEIFHNGQIRPVYPILTRDLPNSDSSKPNQKVNRLPLRKLFTEERESALTTSFSDLDGVPSESYCVWSPNKKSNSTGSNSKRWRFRDLLNRSHSDGGKDSFVFLSHSNSGGSKKESVEKGSGAVKLPTYNNGGEKRRSYLPYREDLVGVFGNVNGLSKALQRF